MAGAWIGLTHPEWYQHLTNYPQQVVDFWKPSSATFGAVSRGERFFCLVRGSPHDQRVFGAMGRFREYRLLSVQEAWDEYGSTMGAATLEGVSERFELTADMTVGHIILDDFRIAEGKVTSGMFARETETVVAPSIQVGKIIDSGPADWLEYAMFGGVEAAVGAIGAMADKVIGNEDPGRREVVRELIYRNRAVIEQAKREQGTSCRVCGFSFLDTYGEHGSGYIEVHHWPMLSAGGSDTTRDVVVVCANCHRMLHRSREGLEWQELKRMIADTDNSG